MDLDLDGRRALVLGSSSGLGRAVAAGLAAEGARVAVVSRSAARSSEASDSIGAAAALVADLTVPGEAARLVADAVAALGGLDICIVNTGGGDTGADPGDRRRRRRRLSRDAAPGARDQPCRSAAPHCRWTTVG